MFTGITSYGCSLRIRLPVATSTHRWVTTLCVTRANNVLPFRDWSCFAFMIIFLLMQFVLSLEYARLDVSALCLRSTTFSDHVLSTCGYGDALFLRRRKKNFQQVKREIWRGTPMPLQHRVSRQCVGAACRS